MTYDFETAVNKLLSERGSTKKSLYDRLGLTRQGYEKKLKNNTVSVVELSEIATFFNIDEATLIALASNQQTGVTNLEKSASFGDRVIDKMAGDLSELKRFFEEEIRMKNMQIAGLQRTVDVLVGKYEGADLDQLLTATGDVDIDLPKYQLGTFMKTVLPIFLPQAVTK